MWPSLADIGTIKWAHCNLNADIGYIVKCSSLKDVLCVDRNLCNIHLQWWCIGTSSYGVLLLLLAKMWPSSRQHWYHTCSTNAHIAIWKWILVTPWSVAHQRCVLCQLQLVQYTFTVMMHVMWRDVAAFSPEMDRIMEDMATAENGMLRVPIKLPGFAFYKAMKV